MATSAGFCLQLHGSKYDQMLSKPGMLLLLPKWCCPGLCTQSHWMACLQTIPLQRKFCASICHSIAQWHPAALMNAASRSRLLHDAPRTDWWQ
jgi:hypothetical protein